VVRFPSERSTGARLSITIREFLDFVDSCSLINCPSEGGCFTWSSYEEALILSCVDRFLFPVD